MNFTTNALLNTIWNGREKEDRGGYDPDRVLARCRECEEATDGGDTQRYFLNRYWPEEVKDLTLTCLVSSVSFRELSEGLEKLISGVDPDDVFEY